MLSLWPFSNLSIRERIVAAYDCSKCPGYCCSYPVIPLNSRDVKRLARHFGLGFEAARKKFTKVDGDEPYAMRRKADEHFGRICRFFDTDKRRCTIYHARPGNLPLLSRRQELRLLRLPGVGTRLPGRQDPRRVDLE